MAQSAATAVDVGTAPLEQRAGSLPQDKAFSRDDFENFLRGYRSQSTERDFWISDEMIEGEQPSNACHACRN